MSAFLLKEAPLRAQEGQSHLLDLEWEAIPNASRYELELREESQDSDDTPPLSHRTRKTRWRPKVPPGEYLLRIRAFDERGVPGPWSEESPLQVLLPVPEVVYPKAKDILRAQERKEQEFTFRWQPVVGAEAYELEVESADLSFQETWRVSENWKSVDLLVGQDYRYRLRSLGANENLSAESETWTQFKVLGPRLKPPAPQAPLTKIIDRLRWEESEDAEHYTYDLLRKVSGKKWVYVEKAVRTEATETSFAMQNPTGTYMLRLTARAKNRLPSVKSRMTFQVRGGFRSPAAVQDAILQESLKKSSHFYGIGSYFITQASYEGLNKEKSGQSASYSGLSGTGRLGFGYKKPESRWGFTGIFDLSGLLIEGENNVFSSIEGHATYSLFPLGAHQLTFSAGPFLTELPEIIGNEIDGLQSFDKITNMGLHAGFRWWRPLSEKYGLQINARFYLPVTGSSPTGESIEILLSQEYSLLGSYRWSKELLMLAGYSYQLRQAGYAARSFDQIGDGFAQEGDVNSVKIQGNYLHLMMEYSF